VIVFLAHALNSRDPTHGALKLILDAVFDSGCLPYSHLTSPKVVKSPYRVPHPIVLGATAEGLGVFACGQQLRCRSHRQRGWDGQW
jgi:hypothetical protein